MVSSWTSIPGIFVGRHLVRKLLSGDTHWTSCCTWTSKMVGDEADDDNYKSQWL